MRWCASTRSIYAARIYGSTNLRLSVSRNCQRNIVPRSNSIPFSLFKFRAECWIADRPVKCTHRRALTPMIATIFYFFRFIPPTDQSELPIVSFRGNAIRFFHASRWPFATKNINDFERKKIYIHIYYLKILYHESRRRRTTIITFITSSIFDRTNHPSSTNLIRKRESYRTLFLRVPIKISKPLFTLR